MGIRDIRDTARGALHSTMSVPASYYSDPATYVGTVNVRLHTRSIKQGDLKGTNLNYAEIEEIAPKLVFLRSEVSNPPRGGFIVFAADEGYVIGPAEPPHGITVKASAAPMSAAQLAGKILPG